MFNSINDIPYNTQADFRVEYTFYNHTEGNKIVIPFLNMKPNFWYDHEDHKNGQIFVIWPVFENEHKEIIVDQNAQVPKSGTARMHIVNKHLKKYHFERLKIGTVGYFIKDGEKIGEAKIIDFFL